jgi:hypothetical protein
VCPQAAAQVKRSQSHHSLLSDIKHFLEDEEQVIDNFLEKSLNSCDFNPDHIIGIMIHFF